MLGLSLKHKERHMMTKTIGGLSDVTTDLQIVCNDGLVRTQQAVLSWSSGFLRRLFTSHFLLQDGGKRKDEVVIFLKDYSVEVITAFVSFLFNGELTRQVSKPFIEDFKRLWEDIRVDKISYLQVFEDGKALIKNTGALGSSETKTEEKNILPQNFKTSFSPAPVTPLRKSKLPGKSSHQIFQESKKSSIFKSPRSLSTSTSQGNLKKNLPSKAISSQKVVNNISSSKPASSETSKKPDAALEDDDAIMIVDEVTATKPVGLTIKCELPAGISITKRVSTDAGKEDNKTEADGVKSKGDKVAETPPRSPSVPRTGEKPRQTNPPPRAVRRRSAATAVTTYNLDKIEEAVFQQEQQDTTSSGLSKCDNQEIVAKTKSLRIPLAKISGNELTIVKGKEKLKRGESISTNSNPLKVTPRVMKTPFKASLKLSKTPFKSTVKKVISNARDVQNLRASPTPSKTPLKLSAKNVPSEVEDHDMEGIVCYICKESKDSEGRVLCLKNLRSLRHHVSVCLYEAGKLFRAIPAGPDNSDEDGRPLDDIGHDTGRYYTCEVEGCWLAQKRNKGRIGYKEYSIHMASHHGAMDLVLMEDGDEAVKLMERIMEFEGSKNTNFVKAEEISNVTLDEVSVPVVKEEQKVVKSPKAVLVRSEKVPQTPSRPRQPPGPASGLVKCRFESCSSAPFNADNKRDIKLHYASQHFNDYFVSVPDNFVKNGNRTLCQVCSKNAPKPVFIQSEKEAIRGHLVVKHDIMGKVLLEARANSVKEAGLALQDIYPGLYDNQL